jgi:hypothetical protein
LKFPEKGKEKESTHLILKSADTTIDVTLCPKSYLDEMAITFSKGDEISLTASKVKDENEEIVLVREVIRGTDTLVLRDNKGDPVWNWHH